MIPIGTMARLHCTNSPVSDRAFRSDCGRPSYFISYRSCSRIGGRVHRDLVAGVKHGSEPGEDLGHRRGEHHVPGGQEERWWLMSVIDSSGCG